MLDASSTASLFYSTSNTDWRLYNARSPHRYPRQSHRFRWPVMIHDLTIAAD
jgi:hypothetical protein